MPSVLASHEAPYTRDLDLETLWACASTIVIAFTSDTSAIFKADHRHQHISHKIPIPSHNCSA